MLGIDPGQVAAGAAREIAAGGCARQPAAIGVEPPQISILRIERTGHAHALDPLLREDATPAPLAAAQHQEADARLIAGMDRDAAAPMRAAWHRLHPPAVHLDIRVAVALPLPIG